MEDYQQAKALLAEKQYTWLVTGVAGFIGSHLLETLLKLEQRVIGLDNFATGYQKNLDQVQALVKFSRTPPALHPGYMGLHHQSSKDAKRSFNFLST